MTFTAAPVMRARDISKTYGVTRALKGVNFEVRRGKVTVLFGENGAGKSTLMKILVRRRAADCRRASCSTASRSTLAVHATTRSSAASRSSIRS